GEKQARFAPGGALGASSGQPLYLSPRRVDAERTDRGTHSRAADWRYFQRLVDFRERPVARPGRLHHDAAGARPRRDAATGPDRTNVTQRRSSLESVLDPELQDPGIATDRLNAAEVARTQRQDRVPPCHGVEEIECLEPALQVSRGREIKESRHGKVRLPRARPPDAVTRMVAKRTGRRIREGCAVQVVVQRLVAIDVVGLLIDALCPTGAHGST